MKDGEISEGENPISKEEGWEQHQLWVTQNVEPPVQAQGHHCL